MGFGFQGLELRVLKVLRGCRDLALLYKDVVLGFEVL